MKRIIMASLALIFCIVSPSYADIDVSSFKIRPYSANEFYTFTKVFAEMRGPLRSEILKDKKTDFKNADPLKYVMKIKDEKDVKKALASASLTWEQFEELMGNILLSYLSIQPQKTKAAIVRQMAGYGFIPGVPEEYQQTVIELLKSEAGSELAGMAMEIAIQIPEENKLLARKNEKQLDRSFYTKYWKDKL